MEITHLHVEASTYCNARCPGCPRNAYGVNLPGLFPLQHLTIEKFQQVLRRYPKVHRINFNGNLGDPMMNPDIGELVRLAGENVKCNVTTNGSIGRLEQYKTLADMCATVTFSIDGLRDTNHLYRQDVDWNKLMERANTFIQSGGNAVWKMVLFRHNKHQVEEARRMSESLGFESFFTIDHGRNYFPALTKDRRISHWILPAEGDAQPDDNFNVNGYIKMILDPFNANPPRYSCSVSCEHLRGSVYVGASGTVHPCCFQGFDLPDRNSVAVENFEEIRSTWDTDNVNPVCASNCKIN
jgi:MoaA/NifB/PqqE/SkfB family radical SAM enzyme